MLPTQPPQVLVLAEDAQAGRAWAEMLADVTPSVWNAPGDVPPEAVIEVVVTNLSADEVARRAGSNLDASQGLSTARWVTIGVGSGQGADLVLPTDFTPRELCLACALAGEVARLWIARDEISRAQHETMQLADTDPLTGLANRRAWTRQLERQWLTARTTGRPLWLAIGDLDAFKQVNDRHGFSAGDQVLELAARAMAAQLRKDDVLARLGGDEFGVLLVGITEEHARAVFERLRAAVAAQEPPAGARQPTTSIGYATSERHAEIREMLSAAERALREAKLGGGNRVCGDAE